MKSAVAQARLDPAWAVRLDDYVAALAWLPDGQRLVAAETSGAVVLLDAKSGERRVLGRHAQGAMDVAVRADGKLVATSGQDGNVILWDTGTWTALRRLELGRSWVERVAFQPRGQALAVAAGKQVSLYDAAGERTHELPPHAGTVAALAWAPSGRQLAVAAYGRIDVHGLARDGLQTQALAWQGAPLAVAWSPDARFVVAGFQDGSVHFWRTATGANSHMSGYETKVRALSWSANGKLLATAGGQAIVIWDFGGKGPEGTRPLQLTGHTERVSAVAFQPQGGHLVTGGKDWRLALWRPAATQQMLDAHLLDSPATHAAWSHDSKRLCVAAESGELSLYTLA